MRVVVNRETLRVRLLEDWWRVPAGILLGALCVSPVPRVHAQSTRDSAGVRIVENNAPQWTPAQALRLAPSPALVIGTREGDAYQLSRIGGAVRLHDGRIVIADGGSLQLRFFDSTGAFLKAVGGRGQGPGEFQRLTRLRATTGDTLLATDDPAAVSYFSPGGDFLRRLDANAPPIPMPTGIRQLYASFGDGSRVVGAVGRIQPREAGASWVDSAAVALVDQQNAVSQTLGGLPFIALVMHGATPGPPWFGPTAVVANDDWHFYFGYGGEFAIQVYSAAGRLERVVHRRWTPVKVTARDVDAFVEEWGRRWIRAAGAEADAQRRELRDEPHAATLPAFCQFLVDGAGRLWVREAHAIDAAVAGQLNNWPLVPSVWSVFDAEGAWLGDVTMPARFLPTEIGADYVLGVARDADEVQTVVLYRLVRGSANR